MSKNKICVIFLIILFIFTSVFIVPHEKVFRVNDVISPSEFVLDKSGYKLKSIETFDFEFTERNRDLAKNLGITEEEAFVLGNLAKQWSINLMKGRNVLKKGDKDLIYLRYSYKSRFRLSGFCLENSKPFSEMLYKTRLNTVRKGNFKVLDLDADKIYSYKDEKVRSLKNFIVIRNSHLKKTVFVPKNPKPVELKLEKNNIKVILSDLTTKFYPTQDCSTYICKEILHNINNAQKSIDIAIYGYSKVPEIENALRRAILRGVSVRLIYDIDLKGENIYPNTDILVNMISQNTNDKTSLNFAKIMHNKFYIFDDEKLITGSANLSNTDMSGFNSNSIISVNSKELAKIYKQEFEQMYNGKFHTEKSSFYRSEIKIDDLKIRTYFSPQDKALEKAVLPLIRKAKNYIYIPTFVLTEKRVVNELINAKKRGVDVKILIDALNASIKHSKHNELRLGGVEVKTENYAGKMHSKSMIVDDKYTVIGSMNFSNSGENYNDENMVLIENIEIAKFYKSFFLYQWSKIDNKWLNLNARAESKDSLGSCSDGIDNDYDGLIDLQDDSCK